MFAPKKYTAYQLQRISQLRAMTPAQWDSICKRCGVCCLGKVAGPDHETLFTDLCCSHFDRTMRRCSVYASRFTTTCGNCKKVDLDVVLDGELLPASCAYVEYIFGPAPYPALVDFNFVTPVTDAEFSAMTAQHLAGHIFSFSQLWMQRNARAR